MRSQCGVDREKCLVDSVNNIGVR